MAWKPKTIFGKIIKGAVTVGGSVLGLAAGGTVVGGVLKGVGKVVGAITGKGTTALSTAGSTVLSGIKGVVDKVKESAVNLVSGVTSEHRDLIKAQKELTAAEMEKLKAVEKLVNAGSTVAAARAAVGLPPEELPTYDGQPVQSAGFGAIFQNKTVLIGLAALAGLALITRKR